LQLFEKNAIKVDFASAPLTGIEWLANRQKWVVFGGIFTKMHLGR